MLVSKKELARCKTNFEWNSLIAAQKRFDYLTWLEGIGGGFSDDEQYLKEELEICRNQIEYYTKRLNIHKGTLKYYENMRMYRGD